MMKRFKKEWVFPIIALTITGVFAAVMLFSIIDPMPNDELVIARLHDLMLALLGYLIGKDNIKKVDKE